ncbi:hypothetical protein VC83_08676 [Pseudogymnoascus destructans]|uniref:Kinesin motor domain-containing protein n=1 Tax=Pseudogymnoascus destructans TaxID=655981 RepID=A0A177A185_9PEZI|nr:uncharacterized protein VC83_08676 [Pseudogymnoascus destructans]OAF54853.2 hypothetical protein VC83_08676 [Pseudogymnoascus destructans]
MATSPPGSPDVPAQRPMSVLMRPSTRSTSRLSMTGKLGGQGAGGSRAGGSRASDEDGKTSVRVAIRVRPPLRPEDPGYELVPQRFQRSMVQVTSPTSVTIDSPQGRKLFVFDRVFGEDVNQEGVWEYLSESVNAFVQGYNVSMLAYGQSGAGKSYTMGTSGPDDQGDMDVMGVIPRAAAALFEKLEGPKPASNRDSISALRAPKRYSAQPGAYAGKPAEKNWTLKATYVEIYNEQLRDLLVPEHVPMAERGQVSIREDTKGHILLTGLHAVDVNSVEDLLNALNFGSMIRQTDSTAINAKSSRSHAVFSLNLLQRKSSTGGPTTKSEKRFSVPLEAMTGSESWVTIDSKFHFVDLAGSERLKNTGAQGERAKEGISINAGLASLGKVISQLSSRQAGSHVSYRDSKLTRMLQDSLGGNAITYMVACVTPAEFHLSETLNTVQYAQRARAIQSKPRIQQVSDETDKQALIDRLKAEVAFLREQIRSSGCNDHPASHGGTPSARSDRRNDAEIDLQNQLLDSQESYNALSSRHAKLISEMTKARDTEIAENATKEDSLGDRATERLQRSNAFAEAVEQVVLEYEETIRSLEQSLSSTRASLSNTETTLLERETKCAYIETVNSQLQARLQKLMDREASTENYLHDLEIKLDGHTSGEEKNSAIVAELRKEIARVRENEASCEDYISTLEERLAESDSDAEVMRREIERLEHVVERQRSLGKLDKLLYELDSVRQAESTTETPAPATNGKIPHSRNMSYASRHGQSEVIHERDEIEGSEPRSLDDDDEKEGQRTPNDVPALSPDGSTRSETDGPVDNGEPLDADEAFTPSDARARTPTLSRKPTIDVVTAELLDLRMTHESTVSEYGNLAAKYEEALRALAELQDVVEGRQSYGNAKRDSMLSAATPAQTRPTSFLAVGDSAGAQSRSLSSELCLVGESPSLITHASEGGDVVVNVPQTEETAASAALEEQQPRGVSVQDEAIAAEVESLRALAAEREAAQLALAEKYAQLEEQHAETLDVVEELKTEVHKAKMDMVPKSPKNSSPVIRRKSSQGMMIIDRAHRSFASLRNIATEHFEAQPDVMQNFELNLNAAMHELHMRSERVQELEADMQGVKREMETKMSIISGLTRERTSISQAPIDMSALSRMQEQIMMSENELRVQQEMHAAREAELGEEVEGLRRAIKEAGDKPAAAVSAAAATVAAKDVEAESTDRSVPSQELESAKREQDGANAERESRIAELEGELKSWEGRHQEAPLSMQGSERQLQDTITKLENQIKAVKRDNEIASAAATAAAATAAAAAATAIAAAGAAVVVSARDTEPEPEKETDRGIPVAEFEAQQTQHEERVSSLQKEIEEHRSAVQASASQITQLEEAHALTKSQLADTAKARDVTAADAEEHKSLVSRLEEQISAHEGVVKAHQDGLAELHASHAREVDGVKESGKAEQEVVLANLAAEHQVGLEAMNKELMDAREGLISAAERVAAALGVEASVDALEDRIAELATAHAALTGEKTRAAEMESHVLDLSSINDKVMKELETVKSELATLLSTTTAHATVKEQLEVLRAEMSALETKNKKNSRLVEELEDQLAANFDQHQAVHNRLSTLQSERNSQLDEANAARARVEQELNAVREEYAGLQAKLDEIALSDNTAGARTSNSSSSTIRKTLSVASPIPSPPPAGPLPPIPHISIPPNSLSLSAPLSPKDATLALAQMQEDQEAKIRSIEKHLSAEKQLTATLEEALTDLERQSNKVKAEAEAWRRRAMEAEAAKRGGEEAKRRLEEQSRKLEEQVAEAKSRELEKVKSEATGTEARWSIQRGEAERRKRGEAERMTKQLEDRMGKVASKKKKGSLNCF